MFTHICPLVEGRYNLCGDETRTVFDAMAAESLLRSENTVF
ncbi:hypothetical protein BN903_124 [Halorubrum sp. AJ67]|nr:hypothetical protein BN903_124 [Halorubrum sp. AJ67]